MKELKYGSIGMSSKCSEGLGILVDGRRIWEGIEGVIDGELEEEGEVGK